MPVLTEVEIAALKRDVERAIWLSRSHFRTATENLLDTLDAKDERIKELEEALTKLVNAYHGLYVANQFNCGRKTNDEEIENIPVIKTARKALGGKDAQDV